LSISARRTSARQRARLRIIALEFAVELAEIEQQRPRTRAECRNGPRPCPWVGCRHHLYLEVNPETGTIKLVHPDKDPTELENTCSLDVAEHGGLTLERVGEVLNLTRERMRQIEARALVNLGKARSLREATRE
jgi:hypothetical protein